MPTYEYQCKTCGHRFEYFQTMSAEKLTHCPSDLCIQEEPEKRGTGEVVRRVSGGAGLVFKGTGFYLTDYVRKEGSGSEGGSKESSGKSKKDSGGATEAGGGSKTDSGGKSDSASGSSTKGKSGGESSGGSSGSGTSAGDSKPGDSSKS